MPGEECLLEDGYFVCVKRDGLNQTEILTALLADGACFEGDVGKLSCLHGATLPIEIPASPAFMAKDGEGYTITPGAWMPFCPVLFGAGGIVPSQKELLMAGGLSETSAVLSTDEIRESARKARIAISQDKGKRWSHLSNVQPVNSLSDEDVDALFAIFPHVHKDERDEHVIYMINTLHGAASAALSEIQTSTTKRMTLGLMQTVTRHCENVNADALQATLVPFYSKYGVGGATTLTDKRYVDRIGELAAQSLSMFSDLGERKPVPKIPFLQHTCSSDVFKMFPGGIDGVDSGTHILELCRAVALGVPGKTTTSSGSMDPCKYNMGTTQDQNEISIPGTDLATFICLATLYTAQVPEGSQLRECEPRHLHVLNMVERLRALREEKSPDGHNDSMMPWWLRLLIDDQHAGTLYSYMDTGSAIHRLDYVNLAMGKPEERKTIRSFAEKTYQRPLITMPKAGTLVRLWVATGGDFSMYAALVRAMERDVWRCRTDNMAVTQNLHGNPQQCSCASQATCIHRIITDWCSFTKVHRPDEPGSSVATSSISSATDGMQKRAFLKRTAAGKIKEPEKMPHDSMFTGTLRCTSAYDIMCSPVGTASLNSLEGTSTAKFEKEWRDATEPKKPYWSLSSIINSIMKKVSMGTEEENKELYEKGMAAGDTARKMTMAKMGKKQLQEVMFGKCSHIAWENGKASWEPGTRDPIGGKLNGRRYVSLKAELAAITEGAMKAWLSKVIDVLRVARKECLDVKNSSTSTLSAEEMWKVMIRFDPNLNQYDAMNVPLLTATMVNILRPVVTAQKAVGLLFPHTGFQRDFPCFDRTKLDDVFGEGGNVQYGMNGKFPPQEPQISVFTLSNPPTCVPCIWKGPINQRMVISTCRVKGISKGKDVNRRAQRKSKQLSKGTEEACPTRQQQTGSGPDDEEDATVNRLKQILSATFVFETDEGDDIAYNIALQEMENVLPGKQKLDLSMWMKGCVIGAIVDIVGKGPDINRSLNLVAGIMTSSPKWRYVCKVLDIMHTVYSPSGFFTPGNGQSLSTFKYLLAYMTACRVFNASTFHNKPIYTMCGFVGTCTQKIGRGMNYVLNYDALCAQDAPYVTTPMDYTLYGSSLQAKVFGGPCMTRSVVTQSGILRPISNPVFQNRYSSPYFVMITPCIPFPDRNTEDKKLRMLSVMSFEEIVSHLESEKVANVVARACGYDSICSAVNAEEMDLVDKLSCLSVSNEEAVIIARLLQSKAAINADERTTADGIQMTWDDIEIDSAEESYNVNENCNMDELINMYE